MIALTDGDAIDNSENHLLESVRHPFNVLTQRKRHGFRVQALGVRVTRVRLEINMFTTKLPDTSSN